MSRMLSKMNLISVVQQLPKEDIETIQGYVEMIEEENQELKEINEEHKKLNGELREENQKYKEVIEKAIECVEEHRIKNPYHYEYNCFMGNARATDLLDILKEVK